MNLDSILHYTIEKKLGEGGMGEVFLATDTKLDRKVALKFLPESISKNPEARERLLREAKAASKLNHPGILTIHAVEKSDDRDFIVMEYIDGQPLGDYFKAKNHAIDHILQLAIQICEGLQEAHTSGITHRDLKPSNILIDAKHRAHILDFGLAKMEGAARLTRTGSTVGTAAYMSPEQTLGQEADHRSDLFSLGILLYEMITGRLPFQGDSEAALAYAIAHEQPEPLARFKADVSDELQRIVSKLLEKDPSLRYQSAADVISDLKRLLAPTHSSMAVAAVKHKTRWPFAVTGLLIIAVLILAGTKYWPGGETERPVAPSDGRIMLAVLPFENLGAPEDEYFADGITDEITSRVGVLKGLGVIARTSVLQYKGTTKRVGEIGSELNVDYMLEGTIRWDKSGDVEKVRITPQLIRVSDETHLWADNIQRDLSQIFEVQEEIAISIAGALNVTLLSKEREALDYRPTENLEAYDLYLRAKNYVDHTDYLKAIELLDKATELDSTFALAFALKSQSYSTLSFFNESGFSQLTKPARLAYNRAFEIQPDLPEAHLARGTYLSLIERDYSRALEELDAAQLGNVDEAQVLNAISMIKLRQGKWREAIAVDQQAIKLDPRSFRAGLSTIQANWFLHQYDEALEAVERSMSVAPDQVDLYIWKAGIQISMGEDVEKIQESLSEWLRRVRPQGLISGTKKTLLLKLMQTWNLLTDIDAEIAGVMSKIGDFPNPQLYLYAGLLYQQKGDEASSSLYLDSACIIVHNRGAELRSDTSGRFEEIPVNNHIYDFLAVAYSLANRHKLAIDNAQIAMESMPIEACHW